MLRLEELDMAQQEFEEMFNLGELSLVSFTAGYRGGEPCETIEPHYEPDCMNEEVNAMIHELSPL